MGRTVLGVIGAAAGAVAASYGVGDYYTNITVGWSIGYGVGAATEEKPGTEGPRLSDLRFTSSSYGQPIPWIRGSPRVSGQIVWASTKREISNTASGGKGGGGENTSFTYEMDVLVLLCDHTALAVSRIWSNGKLIWTRRAGATDASIAASDGTDLWRRLQFYSGAADQLPDPTYEAAVGVGNAPAYRGRASLMIEGLALGSSGQLPNLTFEVVQNGTSALAGVTTGPTQATVAQYFSGTAAASSSTTFRIAVGQWDTGYLTTAVKVFDIDVIARTSVQVGTYNVAVADVAASGATDTAMLVLTTGTTIRGYLGTAGTQSTWTLPVSLGSAQTRFARAGSDIVFGSTGFGAQRIYRYASSGGASALATSAVLADFVQSICVIGTTVYAAAKTAGNIYVLDLATLTLQSTLAKPASGSWDRLFALNGLLAFSDSTGSYRVWLYSSSAWTQIGTLSINQVPGSDLCPSLGVVGGLLVGGHQTSATVYTTWTAGITITPAGVPVQTVVEALCSRAGMPAGTYDASGLSTITRTVRSLALTSGGTRGTLEQMASAFFFQACLRDKVYFRQRGLASAATIPWNDLAANPDHPAEDSLPLRVGNDLELPPQVAVSYINVNDDAQTGTEYSDRMTGGQAAVQTITLGIGMTPPEAKGIADAMVVDTAAALVQGAIALPMAYAALDPSDVVDVVDRDGRSYRLRLIRKRDERGVLAFEVVGDDATALTSQQLTDTSQAQDSVVTKAGDTVFQALDIPLLRDADDGPGYYVAAKGSTTTWPGGQILSSANNVDFKTAAEVNESAVFGTCSTTLGTFAGIGFDEVSSVTVNVGNGTLASSTRDAMLLDATVNAAMVGDELIRFRTATMSSAGIYVLTGLLRGQKGTEWAVGTHAASERFTLLRPAGLRRVSQQASESGQLRYLRAGTLGSDVLPATTSFTNTNRSQKPLAPVDLRADRLAATGDVRITWKRRTRAATQFCGPGGISVPLGETVESYVVRLYGTSSYTVPIRTVTVSTQAAVYAFSDLVADSASYADGVLYTEVRQINGLGVEGYGTRATLSTGVYGAPSDPPAAGTTTKRVFFRYTPATNTSAYAFEAAEYGGGGDESTQVGVHANYGPLGSWLAQLDGAALYNQPRTTYTDNGSGGRTAVTITNLLAAGYDSATTDFLVLRVNSGTAVDESRVSIAGAVTSTTATTLNGSSSGWASPSQLIKYASTWRAFGKSGAAPVYYTRTGAATWTSATGWDVGGLPTYSGSVQAVGLMSAPSAALVAGVVYTDTAGGNPQANYLMVFVTLDGTTWTKVAAILLNTAGGLVSTSGSAAAVLTPAPSGNEFVRVGSKLAFYFSTTGTGGQGPGTYVAISGASATDAWTVSKCTVDGDATLAPGHVVGTASGSYVVARRMVDVGYQTARAYLLVSTNGIAFTTVSDAGTWATGYGNTAGDYMPISGSVTADLRNPLFADGDTVVFERKLRA